MTCFKVPSDFKYLASIVCEYHTHCHKIVEMTPKKVIKLLKVLHAYQQKSYVTAFALSCYCDAAGRGIEISYSQLEYLLQCKAATQNINTDELIEKGLTGQQIGEAIHKQRINIIKEIKKQCQKN